MIEDNVRENALVRFIDTFVESIDLHYIMLRCSVLENYDGRPSYDPH